jgi:hypothetical protein
VKNWGLTSEPSAWFYVIRMGLLMAMNFGLKLTAEQQASVLMFSEAVLALFGRSIVTPNAKLDPEVVQQAKEKK